MASCCVESECGLVQAKEQANASLHTRRDWRAEKDTCRYLASEMTKVTMHPVGRFKINDSRACRMRQQKISRKTTFHDACPFVADSYDETASRGYFLTKV